MTAVPAGEGGGEGGWVRGETAGRSGAGRGGAERGEAWRAGTRRAARWARARATAVAPTVISLAMMPSWPREDLSGDPPPRSPRLFLDTTFDRFEADFGHAAYLNAERRSGGSELTSDKFANLLARNEAGDAPRRCRRCASWG